MTATAKSLATTAEPEAPAPAGFVIDPKMVTVNKAGTVWKEVFVRLPRECIADDLKRPEIWKRVQNNFNVALVKFDHVVAVAYDESWIAEAVVASAEVDQVVLGKPRITQFPDRFQSLLQDDTYRIDWTGFGYAVVRKRDGAQVCAPVQPLQLAERNLYGMYPQRVATGVRG